MPYAQVNGIRLYFESHGEGETIVFLHGRGGNHLSWWQQISFFKTGFRCVAIDHREFGFSREAKDGPGRAAFADDLKGLLDNLQVEKAFLVGQSMGGGTALSFAVRFPTRVHAVVLADTSGGIVAEEILADFRSRVRSLPQDASVRALSAAFRERDPDRAFLYREISLLSAPVRETFEQYLLSEDGPAPAELARYHIPTLIVVGSDDIVVTPAVAAMAQRYLDGSRLEVVRGAGHSAYFEMPDSFNQLVADFIRECKNHSSASSTPAAR